jgi:hypothetical protein
VLRQKQFGFAPELAPGRVGHRPNWLRRRGHGSARAAATTNGKAAGPACSVCQPSRGGPESRGRPRRWVTQDMGHAVAAGWTYIPSVLSTRTHRFDHLIVSRNR